MMKNMLMNTLQRLNPVPLIRSQKFVCGYWDWKEGANWRLSFMN